MSIRGILFDIDGLMLDTERLTLRAWREAGKLHGVDIPEAVAKAAIGLNSADTRAHMLACLPRLSEAVLDAVVRDRRAYMHAWVQSDPPVKPGLYALLCAANARSLKLGVGTSSREDTARLNLKAAGVLRHFDALVCGDMVEHGKPHPEIYQTAARLLDLCPGECLILEDSRNGIRAAHAAGGLPVLVPDACDGILLTPIDPAVLPLLYARCDDLYQVIDLLPDAPPAR